MLRCGYVAVAAARALSSAVATVDGVEMKLACLLCARCQVQNRPVDECRRIRGPRTCLPSTMAAAISCRYSISEHHCRFLYTAMSSHRHTARLRLSCAPLREVLAQAGPSLVPPAEKGI